MTYVDKEAIQASFDRRASGPNYYLFTRFDSKNPPDEHTYIYCDGCGVKALAPLDVDAAAGQPAIKPPEGWRVQGMTHLCPDCAGCDEDAGCGAAAIPEGVIVSEDGFVLLSVKAAGRVEVPDGVRSIAGRALAYNEGVEELVLPDTVERVGEYAFAFSSVRRFSAPCNLVEIGEKAFFQCRSLDEVSLNEGLESIGAEAFAQSSLGRLVVPSSVREIGRNVVHRSAMVLEGAELGFDVQEANPVYFLDDAGALYSRAPEGTRLVEMVSAGVVRHEVAQGTRTIGEDAYHLQNDLEEVVLPEGLVTIEQDAFSKCASLQTVAFPESLERIENGAFAGTALREAYLPRDFSFLGARAFAVEQRVSAGGSLVVRVHPDNTRFFIESDVLCQRRAGQPPFAVLYLGDDPVVSIPDGVASIAPHAFSGAAFLEELHVPACVGSIHPKSFASEAVISVVLDLEQELCGRSYAVFRNVTPLMLLYSSLGDGIDAERLFDICDYNTSRTNDYCKLGRYAVERFGCPQYLSEANRARLEEAVAKRLPSVVRGLADHGDTTSLNALVDYGFLTAENIVEVIDLLPSGVDAATMGCLLEIKHRRLAGRKRDFSL